MSEPTIGHCRDCRWWGAVEERRRCEPAGWERCGRTESHECDPESIGTLAFGLDEERYRAWLETSPDFGCVMFEAKETTES